MIRSLLVALALVFTLPAVPQDSNNFQSWVHRQEGRHTRVSAGIWDLPTGKLLEGSNVDLALVPASTTKVVSTYAMLKTWKPNYTVGTEIWGDFAAGTVRGDLIFKGQGDPFLVSERIWLLAQELKQRGVRRVTGRVRLDQSAFDDQRFGNGWENTSANTTPPILPLSVNFNRSPEGGLVPDPERLAVDTITRILREAGITIEGGGTGGTPRLIHTFESPALGNLIQDVNKHSNNFMVEMLVKRYGEGSWARGVQRIQAFYQSMLSLPPEKIELTDGSGLSKDNHLSAKTLAIVLRAAWNDFEVGPEMVDSLKIIGGETFKLRVKDPNLTRRIRCKTGHLNGVTSVCGYLQTPDGKLRVFAIILNGNCSLEDAWEQVSRWAN